MIVKATFDISSSGTAFALSPAQAPLFVDEHADGPGGELVRASDFASIKPQVDVLVHGLAYAHSDHSTARVELEVGSVRASVAAMGERKWGAQGIPTTPAAFESLRLSWSEAFGGEQIGENPAGSGSSTRSPPPRIEDPREFLRAAGETVRPAGFSPISPSWPARRASESDRRQLRGRSARGSAADRHHTAPPLM